MDDTWSGTDGFDPSLRGKGNAMESSVPTDPQDIADPAGTP
ncbi:MAG: hypothetical protein ABIP21_08440 [Acidimicrobiia bacterium]